MRAMTVLAAAIVLAAQTTGTASLVGTVTDASGAAIPRAKVTAQNQNTAFVYESLSTDDGDYYIPNLSSGTYTLNVEAPGFKTSIQRDIVLRINETPRINVRLEVGSVTESVAVSSRAPLL